MSQQQPGWGPPQQPYAPVPPAPQPPKKTGAGKVIGFSCLGVVALLVLIGIAVAVVTAGGDSGTEDKPAASAPADPGSGANDKGGEKEESGAKDGDAAKDGAAGGEQSAADRFKAFVAKNGTSNEQEAVQHVTKVQGADEQNDILDSVDIHTDYTGGMMGPHAADGKLLASAFADWKDSANGLVTIYDADGEILSNGNF